MRLRQGMFTKTRYSLFHQSYVFFIVIVVLTVDVRGPPMYTERARNSLMSKLCLLWSALPSQSFHHCVHLRESTAPRPGIYIFMCGLTRELVERPQLLLQTVVFQTPHVSLSRDGSRQLTGRRGRWKGRRDEAALHRRFGRGVRWNGRQSAQWIYVHLLANVFLITRQQNIEMRNLLERTLRYALSPRTRREA